jgi:hypothetical protein
VFILFYFVKDFDSIDRNFLACQASNILGLGKIIAIVVDIAISFYEEIGVN